MTLSSNRISVSASLNTASPYGYSSASSPVASPRFTATRSTTRNTSARTSVNSRGARRTVDARPKQVRDMGVSQRRSSRNASSRAVSTVRRPNQQMQNEVAKKQKNPLAVFGIFGMLKAKISQIRYSQRKAKAGKEFSKNYADKESSASSGPRAALYKGEIGHCQKKAARMQEGPRKGHSNFGFSILDYPKLLTSLVVVAILIGIGAFMYPTAQQYYQTVREEARLQAEYAAVLERNAALQTSIDYLQSDAGVEQMARENFGWVKEGENAVYVSDLASDKSTVEASSVFVSDVDLSQISAPETWYSPFLDVLFGVS